MDLSVFVQFGLFWALVGLPLAGPPRPEDPLLARIAPEQCLYYTTWAGVAEPDPDSTNRSERLMAELEVKRFIAELKRPGVELLHNVPNENGVQKTVLRVAPMVAESILLHPGAFYITRLEVPGPDSGTLPMEGALFVRLGPSRAEFAALLEELKTDWYGQFTTTVRIGKHELQQWNGETPGARVTWGLVGDDFVLGIGADSVQQLLAQSETPAPQWLVALQEEMSVLRRGTLTYANLGKLLAVGERTQKSLDQLQILEAIGLSNLTHYPAVSGLDDNGFVFRTRIEFADAPRGIVGLFTEPLAPADLAEIPDDACLALVARIDPKRLYDSLRQLTGALSAGRRDSAGPVLEALADATGLDIENNIVPYLGDIWQVYTTSREGGAISGWVAGISIRDPEQLNDDRIMAELPAMDSERFTTVDVNGNRVHTFRMPYVPVAPSWCITRKQLLVALYPQPLRAHVERLKGDKSLSDHANLQPLFAGEAAPVVLFHRDSGAWLREIYPLVLLYGSLALNNVDELGEAFSIAAIPSSTVIGRHMRPAVTSIRYHDQALVIESQQVLPVGLLAQAAPAIIASMPPAITAAQLAARRTRSTNNLRQIVIALHNFHDVHDKLPATASLDRSGNALLSWRVHLLPYLGEQELYSQFHLDEPWDSPHNRKLIVRMPDVYRSPVGRSDVGKTNYLGSAGEGGVFGPSDANELSLPLGIPLQEITDGTSNTIAVLEVDDELAVIWSKPGDFTPDQKNPLKGLLGIHSGGLLTAMCDGSVRFLPEIVDPKAFWTLLTRAGNEPVPDTF